MQWVASSVSGCRVLEKLLASLEKLLASLGQPCLEEICLEKLLASLGQLTNWPCLKDEYAYQYAHGTALDFPMNYTVEVTILAQQ